MVEVFFVWLLGPNLATGVAILLIIAMLMVVWAFLMRLVLFER